MHYEDFKTFEQTAAKITEETKAVVLWVDDDSEGFRGVVLGEPDNLLVMYRAIFLGIEPLARQMGWLKV